MSERTVIVDGVKLTESQIRKALTELENPEIKNLTQVKHKDGEMRGVVIVGPVQQAYSRSMQWHSGQYPYTVIAEAGYGSSYETTGKLLDKWELIK